MQHRFAVWSVKNAALQHAYVDMENRYKPWFEQLTNWDTTNSSDETVVRRATADLQGNPLIRQERLTLTDANWHILYSEAGSASHDSTESGFAKGAVLQWRKHPESDDRPEADPQSDVRREMIESGGHIHVAVARPNARRNGWIIVHRSRASIESEATALVESLPIIEGMNLLWTTALLGITAYLLNARFHDEIERERHRHAAEALRQRQQLVRTRDAVIFGLAKLADSRDPDTGDHLERISIYCTTLCNAMSRNPKFKDQVTPSFMRLIEISSALHDIGKVGVEDRILLKPGPLTRSERADMETHAAIGGACLNEIEQRLGSTNFLQMAREIAFAHHEKWDGSGYPRGLKGHEIPLSARIVAVADVYDALTSRRVYKEPYPHEECVQAIRHAAGTQFDPDIVEVWLTVSDKFAEIARRYATEPQTPAATAVTNIDRTVEPVGSGTPT